MSAKDLVFEVARDLNMSIESIQQYAEKLEENFLTTQIALKDIDNDDWKQLGFPIGLSSQMKKKLQNVERPEESPPAEKPKQVSEIPESTVASSTKEDDDEDINLARIHVKTEDRESTFRFDNKLELQLEQNE